MAAPITSQSANRERRWLPVLFAGAASWLLGIALSDISIGDSGEIGSASYVLGVAHPTGFPLDLLLLRAFALVPVGSIALRQNVGVALISAFALTACCAVALELCTRARIHGAAAWTGVLLGACSLLTFRTFWGTALGVEVYSTSLGLLACAALVVLRGGGATRALWPLFGLSLGAHVTAGFLMLPLLAAVLARDGVRIPRLLLRAGLVLLGALVIAYLPLAAHRAPPLDWGDPRTLSTLFAHLTAARIRSSYAREMFSSSGAPALLLLRQLGEHVIVVAPAAFGAVVLWSRARRTAMVLTAVLTFDLGYAVWINPMGIVDRQLGHASGAILAVYAAIGAAELCAQCADFAVLRVLGPASVLMLCAVLCWVTPWPWPSSGDGYVLSERHGSGSPLLELPPRSVYLCTTDSACSAALFASHVELLRPDLIVAPAQHLWDRAVLRKLATTLRAAGVILPDQEPRLPRARAAFADAMLRQLVAQAARRPVFFEGEAAVRQAMPKAPLAASLKAPFMVVADKAPEPERAAIALAAVDAQVHARFGSRGPRTPAARDAWFDAYDVVGKGALLAGDNAQAVASFRRAISLDPKRSTGFSNLGVALEARGELSEAFAATRRALEIDPSRATAWVNLARLSLRAADLEQTRKILVTARRVGVQDRRLDVMERELQGSTGK